MRRCGVDECGPALAVVGVCLEASGGRSDRIQSFCAWSVFGQCRASFPGVVVDYVFTHASLKIQES